MFTSPRRIATAVALLTAPVIAGAQSASPDETAARAPLEAYMQGHRTGDATFMEKAFHPNARMTYMADSGLVIVPISEYIGRMRANGVRATPDTFPRRVAMLNVAGNTAVARIDMELGNTIFADYMTIHKFADGWKIVGKSFYRTSR
jgi:hypothetical protein